MSEIINNKKEAEESIIKIITNQDELHLIGFNERLGFMLFMVRMEYEFFAPRSGRNDLFKILVCKWPEDMNFFVISIPIGYKEQAETLAAECGLKFSDGMPCMIQSDGSYFFPYYTPDPDVTYKAPTCFSLSNVENHPVYGGKNNEELKRLEKEAVDKIIQNDTNKLIEELVSEGYSQRQIDRLFEQWNSGNEHYDEVPENQ